MTFIHGVEVIELSTGLRTITVPSTSVIGLVGPAQYADPEAFPLDTPILITNIAQAAGLIATLVDDEDPGSLYSALDDIAGIVTTPVVIVRVNSNATEATQLALVAGDAEARTGVYALLNAKSVTGYQPKILIATGWTHQQIGGLANPVAVALAAVSPQLRAISYTDGPNDTNAAAISKQNLEADDRQRMHDPWVVTEGSDGNPATGPASARFAAIRALVDQTNGYWWSDSNQTLPGILGLGRPISFAMTDPTSDANVLNAANIATIINVSGFKTWGNRGGSTDPAWVFLSVRRTADIIYDAIEAGFVWAMDRPFSGQLLKDIENEGNAFLRTLKALGAIIDGQLVIDPTLNTPQNMAAGQLYYDFDFEPPAPLERLTIQASRNGDYYQELITSALAQAQAS